MPKFILSLSSRETTLEAAGGKGMSLVRLSRAGLSVPSGQLQAGDRGRVDGGKGVVEIIQAEGAITQVR